MDIALMYENYYGDAIDMTHLDLSRIGRADMVFAHSRATIIDVSNLVTDNIYANFGMFLNSQVTELYTRSETDADFLINTPEFPHWNNVEVYVGKRGEPDTYLYLTTQ